MPRPAGWMEGGLRGERQRKREKYTFVYLSLLNEGRRGGRRRRGGLAEAVVLGVFLPHDIGLVCFRGEVKKRETET